MPHGSFGSARSSARAAPADHVALVSARRQHLDVSKRAEVDVLRGEWRKLRASTPRAARLACNMAEDPPPTATDEDDTARAVAAAVAAAEAKMAERERESRTKDAWLAEQRRLVAEQAELTDALTARYSTSSGSSSERSERTNPSAEDEETEDLLAACGAPEGREPEAKPPPVPVPVVVPLEAPESPLPEVGTEPMPSSPRTPRTPRASGFGQSSRRRKAAAQ